MPGLVSPDSAHQQTEFEFLSWACTRAQREVAKTNGGVIT
jgi:hypothetical protein